MRIQTGLIHFGRVLKESGMSETGIKPVWSQSTSRCGLNADSNRFRTNCEGGNVLSRDRTRVAHQEQQVEDSRFTMAKGWTAEMTRTLVSVRVQSNVQTELDGVDRNRTIFESTC